MFASLYFYSFPCSTTTTTTTIRNKTCLRNFLLCISLIINMKKQKRKIKNVVSPALIIHQANTNSDIICFRAKNCRLHFHLLAMLRIIMQYSLVKLVVDGTAAQKIDNQLAKRSFPVLNWNIDGSSTTFAKNDNCVPHRLCDQPKKNENNLKECWTQLTLRMRETTRARSPIGFLIFPALIFLKTLAFPLIN